MLISLGGRVVAQVIGHTLYRRVSATLHFLRRPPAIAFDVVVIAQAESVGATCAEVYATDTGDRYTADFATIRARGFILNRGYGQQIALPLTQWTKNGVPPASPKSLKKNGRGAPPNSNLQLALWNLQQAYKKIRPQK